MLHRSGLTAALMVVAMTVAASVMSAATLTVTNLNDSGAGSLRAQIAAAEATSAADNVVFQSSLSGAITLATELQYFPSTAGNDLSIDGSVAGGQITVSGGNAVRCFTIGYSGGAAWTFALSNLNATKGGPLQCVKSLDEYLAKGRKWPKQFDDPKYLEKTGLVGSSRSAAGFTVEVSARWEDPKTCPCDCEWTQFVNVSGTEEGWGEDRAPTADPASATAAELRSTWVKCCKPPNDRLYMGDNIIRALQQDERLSGKTIYFRTVFYSSGTNCKLKYVAVDWKLEVYWTHPEDENHPDGKVESKATVLGTSEG